MQIQYNGSFGTMVEFQAMVVLDFVGVMMKTIFQN